MDAVLSFGNIVASAKGGCGIELTIVCIEIVFALKTGNFPSRAPGLALDVFRSSRLSDGLLMRVTVRLLIRVRTANETPKNNS